MKYDDKVTPADGGFRLACADGAEAMLRAEIGFWRDLLRNCDPTMPADSIERMQQALALAESRYLQLQGSAQARRASCAGPVGTSRRDSKSLH